MSVIDELKSDEHERLLDALAFYADEENWKESDDVHGGSAVAWDNGKRARRALGEEDR